MLRRILLILFCAASPITHAVGKPVDVQVLTGDGLNGSTAADQARTGGYGREFINKLMLDAGIHYAIEPQPFARALRTLETSPNAVLFPLMRTAERESKFQWIGLMAKRNYHLYRLKSRKDIVIQSLEDAKQYRIGVLRGDVRTDYLRSQGFVLDSAKGLLTNNLCTST
jgi:polar amino acid transport system substrate-binding protein